MKAQVRGNGTRDSTQTVLGKGDRKGSEPEASPETEDADTFTMHARGFDRFEDLKRRFFDDDGNQT